MKTIDELKNLLIKSFPKEKIYLFGSRAKGTASIYSDYDIAIEGSHSLKKRISIIKTHIENSSIPYKIDLIELSKAPYLQQIIKKEGIVWH
jgi:predicted nucleotidyltransferase